MKKTIVAVFFVSLVLLSSGFGINFLFQKDTLQVKRIVMLNKLQEQDVEQLQQLASAGMNGGFFSLDIDKFRERIETLAWIETVSVRKKWPDTLQLDIHEKQVAARWIISDKKNRTINKLLQVDWNKQSLLSKKGMMFNTVLTQRQYDKYNKLAIYSSPDELASSGLEKCQQISKLLEVVKLEIKQCFQDQRRSWYVHLDNGFNLYLGRVANKETNNKYLEKNNLKEKSKDKILQRITTFVMAYQKILRKHEKNIDRIDMRYTNGFSIKWKA
ncbi:MAG: FtsQ-type POTRA domain-containing protein [Pseudomonadota bacterium]